jgi:predicted PurR-regulated permease PerM
MVIGAKRSATPATAPVPEATPREEPSLPALSRSAFHWVVLLLSVGALLAFLPLWAPLLLASWMAIIVRPLHARLAAKVRGRSRAAGVVTVLLVVLALAPLAAIGVSLFAATMSLIEDLQHSTGARDSLQTLLKSEPSLPNGDWEAKQWMNLARRHGGGALNAATKIFGAATAGAIGLFVFVYAFYTCLVDGRSAHVWLLEHSPLPRKHTARLSAAYVETGRGLLLGVGLTAVLQGAIATVGYLIIGVPQGLVLGLLTVFAALIPSVGTGLVWVPVAVLLLATSSTGEGVAVLVLGGIMSVADNFIRPILSRSAHLDLPMFVLFVAMLGGIGIFGAWGLLLGPLFVRLALEALRLSREQQELGQYE